jgi:restriction system protein
MKWRPSKDSIFGVLMRSPWWMSAGIAVLIIAVGVAALPREYWAVAVFASIPFAVIAVLAGFRQLSTPSAARVDAIAAAAVTMTWATFSSAIQAGFERDGCQVGRLNESGADFSLTKGDHVALVNAKRWKAARTGTDPLRELQAARERRGAREAIYVTLGEVSPGALQYAEANGISFMTAAELAKLLKDTKV